MAGGGILAFRDFGHLTVAGQRLIRGRHAVERPDEAQAKALQSRQKKPAMAAGYVPQGIGPEVAVFGGVRQSAGADAVEHDN